MNNAADQQLTVLRTQRTAIDQQRRGLEGLPIKDH